MNVDVMVNGRPWKVGLEPAEQAGHITVTIKGRSRVVDASWIDDDTVSLIDRGAAREIRLHTGRENGAVGVEFGGHVYEAVVAKRGRVQSAAVAGKITPDPVTTGARHVRAAMPGRVVRVLVAIGDRVTARQAVVIIEAMKMENELRAPSDGVVKEVLVLPGATVESGAVLIVVDP